MEKDRALNLLQNGLLPVVHGAYYDALNMAIEALQTEPCEDTISRQQALDTFCLSEKSRKYGGDHSGYDTIMLYEVQDALEALPSVQPEQKTGRWKRELIRNEHGGCIGAKMICSECGQDNRHDEYMKFCPNCGTRMEV